MTEDRRKKQLCRLQELATIRATASQARLANATKVERQHRSELSAIREQQRDLHNLAQGSIDPGTIQNNLLWSRWVETEKSRIQLEIDKSLVITRQLRSDAIKAGGQEIVVTELLRRHT